MDDKAYPDVWATKSRIADDIKAKITVDAKDVIKYIDQLVNLSVNIDMINQANQYVDIYAHLSTQPGYDQSISLLDNIKNKMNPDRKLKDQVVGLEKEIESYKEYYNSSSKQMSKIRNICLTTLEIFSSLSDTATLVKELADRFNDVIAENQSNDKYHQEEVDKLKDRVKLLDFQIDVLKNNNQTLTIENDTLNEGNNKRIATLNQIDNLLTQAGYPADTFGDHAERLKKWMKLSINQRVEELLKENARLADLDRQRDINDYKFRQSLWNIIDSPTAGGQQNNDIIARVSILKDGYDTAAKDLRDIKHICKEHVDPNYQKSHPVDLVRLLVVKLNEQKSAINDFAEIRNICLDNLGMVSFSKETAKELVDKIISHLTADRQTIERDRQTFRDIRSVLDTIDLDPQHRLSVLNAVKKLVEHFKPSIKDVNIALISQWQDLACSLRSKADDLATSIADYEISTISKDK